MSEKSDFIISFSDYNDEATKVNSHKEKIDINNYQIRCTNCSSIAILNADFKNNYFCTLCENKHKNEYNSFSSFLDGLNKDLKLILCNICQKSKDEVNLFKCDDCNLFFCYDCKCIHKEKSKHNYYEEINKIDNCCAIHDDEKYKYYNVKNQRFLCQICYQNIEDKYNIIKIENILENKERINKEYKKAIENNLICKNIQKQLVNWLNDLNKKVKTFCETLNNYYLIYISVLNCLKNDNNSNNFNSRINYEFFNKNKTNIDLYIHQINKQINNCSVMNISFDNASKNYISILNKFNDINFSLDSEKIKEENINKNIKEFNDKEDELNIKQIKRKKNCLKTKIEAMKILQLELNSEAKCFCSLNCENYLVIGLKSGKIEVYEFIQDEAFKSKIKINEFQNEIKFICELDINLFAATDGKTGIKIIKLTNNMKNYTVIQTLYLKEDSEYIYTMINLPILSYKEKRHYFCTGDEKHILIWKSNKQPQNISFIDFYYENQMENKSIIQPPSILEEIQKNKEDNIKKDEPLYFTLVKDIELNTLTRCLIEVNEKYIAAACKDNTVKIFNVKNKFKKVVEVKKIPISFGSNILSLPNENFIMVGCVNGFYLISTKDFNSTKEIRCKYSVICLETLTKNEIICCCIERNNNKIKHYKIEENLDLIKSSEKKVHKTEIWNLKIINNRIFYTNNNNNIIYLR